MRLQSTPALAVPVNTALPARCMRPARRAHEHKPASTGHTRSASFATAATRPSPPSKCGVSFETSPPSAFMKVVCITMLIECACPAATIYPKLKAAGLHRARGDLFALASSSNQLANGAAGGRRARAVVDRRGPGWVGGRWQQQEALLAREARTRGRGTEEAGSARGLSCEIG